VIIMSDDRNFRDIHFIAEHRRVHRMLRLAQNAISASGGATREAPSANFIQVLRQVRDELAHHFAEEERDGYLDVVLRRCPSLLNEVRRIEAEHPQLLTGVDRLIALAMDCDQSVQMLISLAREFDDLCRHFDAHEAAENVLLRKDIGAALTMESSH
jgi:hypothetical protein